MKLATHETNDWTVDMRCCLTLFKIFTVVFEDGKNVG